jgi:formamidopyrimidine-DNA glycosylase
MTAGPREVKVVEDAVKKVQAVLGDMLVRIDVLEVPEISAGVFGGSANGQALGKEVVEARTRIKSLLSNLHDGVEGLHNGLEGTVRAVKGADEEAEGYFRTLNTSMATLSQPFFDSTGTDNRVKVDLPDGVGLIPGFGSMAEAIEQAMQEATSKSGLETGPGGSETK